jgi:IstB-like ATP binding protein
VPGGEIGLDLRPRRHERQRGPWLPLVNAGRAENLVVAGPSGTGKSHFAEALAHAAIEKDLRVAWFTLETLTAAIGRAKAGASVARTVTRICRAGLIVVDEQHPSLRIRLDHAQDPRNRDRRPAATTPTWSRPRATPTASPRLSPARG